MNFFCGAYWSSAFAKWRKATISFVVSACPSVCPYTRNNSAPTERIFVIFYTWVFFENLSRKFKFHLKLTIITGTLHEDVCTYIYDNILLNFRRMRNVSDKIIEKIKTRILCSISFSPKIVPLSDNVEKYGTARQAIDDNVIRRMRFAWWITKTTHTHTYSEYVILIAFPCQQCLRKRASMLRSYVHCLSSVISDIVCFIKHTCYTIYHKDTSVNLLTRYSKSTGFGSKLRF